MVLVARVVVRVDTKVVVAWRVGVEVVKEGVVGVILCWPDFEKREVKRNQLQDHHPYRKTSESEEDREADKGSGGGKEGSEKGTKDTLPIPVPKEGKKLKKRNW